MAMRDIRKALGRSLRDAEKDTGLDRGFLSRLERGHTGARDVTIQTYADYLGVSITTITHEEK